MARAAKRFEDALVKQANAASRLSPEFKIVEAAMLGLGDSTISLIRSLSSTSGAFASVSASGATAFNSISGAAAGAASAVDQRIALIVTKVREVKALADGLQESAKGQNSTGTLSDDGLKLKLAGIKATKAAYEELAKSGIAQELAAQQVADAEAATLAKRTAAFERLRATVEKLNFEKSRSDTGAERISSSKGAISAIDGAATAQASAQAQVYLASLIAIAAQDDVDAQAEARRAAALSASGAASERAQAAQQAAYATKTAYIARVNEEAAALFRTADAQRQLDAERAGVSPQQAAQLAKFSGDREFIAGVYEKIEAEKKLAAEFGKTTAEILRQQAAGRGISNEAEKPIARFSALADSNKAAADTAALTKSNDAYIDSVNRRANAIKADGSGLKLQFELLAEEAAAKGLTAALDPAIQKIRKFEETTGNAGKQAFGTRNQLLTLKYTLSDIISSAASGISPLTILLQQGPQVAQIEGGLSGVFRTVVSLVTPFRLAMLGGAAAIGAVAFAYYEGSKQSKVFADSLVLTGGFAGVTEGQFNALAKGIAASGQVTVGAARESAQALISTGQIGPQVFAKATQAAALYGKATGQNAAEVAKDFASMSDDAAKWAADHNKSLNFITSAQYDQIKSLQELGKTAEAQGIVYEAIADRFKHVDDNLGTLGKTLKLAKGLWSGFWDAAYDIGREETIEDKIKRAESAAAALSKRLVDGRSANPAFSSAPPLREDNPTERARVGNLLSQKNAEVVALQSDQGLIQQAAGEKARQAELAKLNIAFDATAQAYRFAAKAGSEKKKARAELDAFFDRRLEEGNPVSAQDKADSIKGLNKKFTDQGAVNKGISEADAQRKSNLAKALQGFAADLAKETDVLKFHQSELQAIYSAGSISLAQFNDDKARTTAAGVQAEIDAQNKATARLNAELAGKFKDPHERTDVEKQRNESIAKSANLVRDAQHAAALAVYADAASVKALAKEVEAFNANLLQAKGDDFGAAQLRNAQALKDALEFARKATPLQSTGDVNRDERRRESGTSLEDDARKQGRLNDAAAEFAEVQKRVGIATADATRAEELYILRSKQGGAGLLEQEQGIYTIRATALVQLGELADKAKALAEESRKPEVIAAAKDLALAYAKAAEAVDPALTRLHTLGDEVGTSLTGIFDGALTKATSFNDVLNSIGNTLKTTFIKGFITGPLEKELQGTIRKFLDGNSGIADVLRNGIGASAGKFKGTSNDPSARNFENESDKASTAAEAAKALAAKQDPLLSQTVAVNASTDALASLTAAANGAATALGGKPAAGSTQVAQIDASGLFGKYAGTSNDPSAANYQNESDKGGATAASEKLGSSLALTKSNADQFSAALPIASSFLQSLGGEASIAGRALSLLPSIIQLIQAASGSSVSGLAGLFSGGSGSVGSSASYAANDFIAAANGHAFGSGGLQAFAKGDIFNSPTAFRFAKGSGFAPGVMGEAGPEAVMPLRRGADGRLGVSVGGQATVQRQNAGEMSGGNIYVTNNAPAEVKEAKRDDRGDWHLLIEAAADQAHSRVAADVGSGSGRVASAMKYRGVNLGGSLSKRG